MLLFGIYLGMKRSVMAKQNSLDDVGLDLDEADDDFEEAPDSGNLEGFGRDSPRPGTPVAQKGNFSEKFLHF
jgi:hypothetical protein